MKKKKFYAYLIPGGLSGIAENWPECDRMVSGRASARYRGFGTREEAARWLREGARYEAKPKRAPKAYAITAGIYFDAGTGRGEGGGVSVTDEKGKDLLAKLVPKKKLNKFGKLPLGDAVTNNYGELLGAKYAFIFALKH